MYSRVHLNSFLFYYILSYRIIIFCYNNASSFARTFCSVSSRSAEPAAENNPRLQNQISYTGDKIIITRSLRNDDSHAFFANVSRARNAQDISHKSSFTSCRGATIITLMKKERSRRVMSRLGEGRGQFTGSWNVGR